MSRRSTKPNAIFNYTTTYTYIFYNLFIYICIRHRLYWHMLHHFLHKPTKLFVTFFPFPRSSHKQQTKYVYMYAHINKYICVYMHKIQTKLRQKQKHLYTFIKGQTKIYKPKNLVIKIVSKDQARNTKCKRIVRRKILKLIFEIKSLNSYEMNKYTYIEWKTIYIVTF